VLLFYDARQILPQTAEQLKVRSPAPQTIEHVATRR
jgi:hypothetical protein